MNYGFAQNFMANGVAKEEALTLAVDSVSNALMLFSIGSGIFQFITGFITDKFGRKTKIL